jgi:hypothetical protein
MQTLINPEVYKLEQQHDELAEKIRSEIECEQMSDSEFNRLLDEYWSLSYRCRFKRQRK